MTRRFRRRSAAAVPLLLAVFVTGCSSAGTPSPPPRGVAASPLAPATARLQEHDIYRTLELNGVVEDYPVVALRSPADGELTRSLSRRRWARVSEGQTVAVVKACARRVAATSTTGAATASTKGAAARAGTAVGGPTSEGTGGGSTGTDPGGGQNDGTGECARYRYDVVRAPVSGRLSGVPASGTQVVKADTVGSVKPPGFHVRLTVTDPADLYAFTDPPSTGKGRIVGGPAGFTVRYESKVFRRDDGRVDVFVRLPGDLDVFAGLHAVVVFVTAVRDAVPTLPTSAVQGTRDQGRVVRVGPGGRHEVVEVGLGAQDGDVIEITSGLSPDDEVLLFPLESDFVSS